MEKYKCCICKETKTGYGNNPRGALDKNNNAIKWEPNDRCCDDCNIKYVIKGRIYLMTNWRK